MKSFKRHVFTIIALILYWPAIFIFTHIPLRIPSIFLEFRTSDKILHFMAYFILVYLLWFTINPNTKVNWRKAAVWWILLIVVWYGVFDEWLQGYVGRNPDVKDFMADLCGSISALCVLSILNFWTASIINTAAGIFIFTTLIRTNYSNLVILPSCFFLFTGYAILTVLWIRWIHYFLSLRPPEGKWFIGAFSFPVFFLLLTDLFSLIAIRNFALLNTVFSVIGIFFVVFSVYHFPKLRSEIS